MLYRVIGVMSGSSLDGLDLAFVELEDKGGKWSFAILETACYDYDNEWMTKLKSAAHLNAINFVELDALYGHFLGNQINKFITEKKLDYKVGLIASHGHTVFHSPGKFSVQIGHGAAIAAETDLPVVSDLRALDVALGGQGAPIVPMGEHLLFPETKFFLNLGGIANLSFNGSTFYDAFDVCAANRVLNMLVNENGLAYDDNGSLSAKGRIDETLLENLNKLPYYQEEYPKSLANEFGTNIVFPLVVSSGLSIEDKLATYVEHIATQIAVAVEKIIVKRELVVQSEKIMVTGGGAFNGNLISRIEKHLSPLNIEISIPDPSIIAYKEALVMALLGVLRWREEETVFGSVTGARRASVGGALWMGQS
jgi:anhydro-N-acetylmuramic acid kinase